MSGLINTPGARSGVLGSEGGIGYEEGTWTPVFKSGSDTISHGSANCSYTKIGNLVHIVLYVAGQTTSGTTGGDLEIEGLPFVAKTNYRGASGHLWNNASGFTISANANLQIQGGASKLEALNDTTANSYSTVTVTGVGGTSYIFFDLTYLAE